MSTPPRRNTNHPRHSGLATGAVARLKGGRGLRSGHTPPAPDHQQGWRMNLIHVKPCDARPLLGMILSGDRPQDHEGEARLPPCRQPSSPCGVLRLRSSQRLHVSARLPQPHSGGFLLDRFGGTTEFRGNVGGRPVGEESAKLLEVILRPSPFDKLSPCHLAPPFKVPTYHRPNV